MAAARKVRCLSLLTAALAGGGLTGCGRSETVAAGRPVTIAITEYRLNPSALTIPGGVITVIVRNDGRLTHNLVIAQDGHPEQTSGPVAPGEAATMLVFLLPGRYTMSSTMPSDADLGIRGTLRIT
jgi:plastocyanin